MNQSIARLPVKIILLLLLLSAKMSFAQPISIRYQNGLTNAVKFIIPLSDEQTMLVFSATGEWLAWDMASNRILLRRQSISTQLSAVKYIPAMEKLLLAGDAGLEVYDIRELLSQQKATGVFFWNDAPVVALSFHEPSGSIFLLTDKGLVLGFRNYNELLSRNSSTRLTTQVAMPYAIAQEGSLLIVLGSNKQLLYALPRLELLATATEYNTGTYGYTVNAADSACYLAHENGIKKLSYRNQKWNTTLYTSAMEKGQGLILGIGLDNVNGTIYAGTNKDQLLRVKPGTTFLEPIYRQAYESFSAVQLKGNHLLAGDFFGNVLVLDAVSRQPLFQLMEDVTPSVNGVYLHENAFMVTTHFGNRGTALKIWDLATARLDQSFQLANQAVYKVLIRGGGDSILSYHYDDAIYLFVKKQDHYVIDTLKRSSTPFFYGSIILQLDKDEKSLLEKQAARLRQIIAQKGIYVFPADNNGESEIGFVNMGIHTCPKGTLSSSYQTPAALLAAAGLGPETASWDIMEKDLCYAYACNADSLPVFAKRIQRHLLPDVKVKLFYELVKGITPVPPFFFLANAQTKAILATFVYNDPPQQIDLSRMPNQLLIAYKDSTVIWHSRTNSTHLIQPAVPLADAYFDHNSYFLALAQPEANTITLIPNQSQQDSSLHTRWIAFGLDDYVVSTKEAWFTSKGRSGQVQLFSNLLPVSFHSFDLQYNRPDLVMQRLGIADTQRIQLYKNAWQKRIKRSGLVVATGHPGSLPELQIVNRNQFDYLQTNATVELHIKAEVKEAALNRLNIWVNEVPLFGANGYRFANPRQRLIDTVITVPLSHGSNTIDAAVITTEGAESIKTPLRLFYKTETAVPERVYFIGVGIDRFEDKTHNLRWCVKDIKDLAIQLKTKFGQRLEVDTLFNRNVSVQNILALKTKLLKAGVNDKVIVAYSGHGLLNSRFDYYLSSYLVNFKQPQENGIPFETMEYLLDSIPPRRKLFFLDACHSGEVDKDEMIVIEGKKQEASNQSLVLHRGSEEEVITTKTIGLQNSFELMQTLFAGTGKATGTTIISAAAGVQLAQERGELQNGVFTFSLLEAFRNNQSLRVSQLKEYVGNRVQQLTNGLQKPTTRKELNLTDWLIW
ncbi:MAG: caspase family protein [Chitinophagaceae bacterium]